MLTSCGRQVIMDKLHLNQYAKLQSIIIKRILSVTFCDICERLKGFSQMALIYTDGYFILRAAQLNQVVRYPFICGFLCHL